MERDKDGEINIEILLCFFSFSSVIIDSMNILGVASSEQ